MIDLSKKSVFLTGGTGLIGSTIIDGLIKAQAKVYLLIRDEKSIKKIESIYQNNISFIEGSMEDIDDKFLSSNLSDLEINCVVHAAVFRPSQENLNNEKNSFLSSINTNLSATYNIYDFFAKKFSLNDGGSLVGIGSIYGVAAPDPHIYLNTEMGTEIDYTVIKSSLIGISKYIASYYGQKGVRSNIITLGGVRNNQPKSFIKEYEKKTCLGRMANPNDVFGATAYLLSDLSSYVTGSEIRVDGGYLCK